MVLHCLSSLSHAGGDETTSVMSLCRAGFRRLGRKCVCVGSCDWGKGNMLA